LADHDPTLRSMPMYVGAIHRVSDPEGFTKAEDEAIAAGLPEGFSLPIHAATPDHRVGICIWEGPSVEAVSELVESVVGPFSQNEYFEMSVDGLS
jgi:hypothetical protein